MYACIYLAAAEACVPLGAKFSQEESELPQQPVAKCRVSLSICKYGGGLRER